MHADNKTPLVLSENGECCPLPQSTEGLGKPRKLSPAGSLVKVPVENGLLHFQLERSHLMTSNFVLYNQRQNVSLSIYTVFQKKRSPFYNNYN